MRLPKFLPAGIATLAYLGISPMAFADGREPGSLLIFPEFDNRVGDVTMFTITNVNTDDSYDQGSDLSRGTVDVHVIYVGRFDSFGNPIPCLEVDRDIRLTPGDTFTFLTRVHNPQQQQGFMFAYAVDPITHLPIDFDYLIGNALFINGIDNIDYSMNPLSLRGKDPCLDTDGHRDLDDNEYGELPDEIKIPRFLGSVTVGEGRSFRSELILLGLSGGSQFTTIVDLLVYNDNEEVFSAQRQFQCWERVPLDAISGVFTNSFLKTTNHTANEPLGATSRESGWIHLDGNVAYSSVEQITDPAVYAVLVERVGRGAGAADLPFECGEQDNGDLWPNGPWGDNGPMNNE